ncbi:3-oxoacyl-[acyl-carrier protein] reductase [Kribbella aluminosa]|uniref:3-oxoacyl-[acyl-carrier protein] reductase n=1 Tax=Kribbella aluminosa TaxID=416017 RepID=A0ABS4UKE0_9ACTN|nr:SDR family NAD(P)-dependent oxidoreductase [Kribbella aluminosa]MBP2352126.1 3-oxoacyl-[acyl-carrier protein] reductase [Kribbella aluminosa]
MLERPVALVTGVGRTVGIGAGIARRLAESGWDVAFTYWTAYDERMKWGVQDGATAEITAELTGLGVTAVPIEADLADPGAPERIFAAAEDRLGPVTALVMCHCESVDSSIRDTTVESFDRHFAVNARATWLLIREYAARFAVPHGSGRIVALTSDHTVHNLPYGASKGALDRITLAAAQELSDLGLTANVINPGPIDTGWMSPDLRTACTEATPLGPPRHPHRHRQPRRLPPLPPRPMGQRPTPEKQRRLGLVLQPDFVDSHVRFGAQYPPQPGPTYGRELRHPPTRWGVHRRAGLPLPRRPPTTS